VSIASHFFCTISLTIFAYELLLTTFPFSPSFFSSMSTELTDAICPSFAHDNGRGARMYRSTTKNGKTHYECAQTDSNSPTHKCEVHAFDCNTRGQNCAACSEELPLDSVIYVHPTEMLPYMKGTKYCHVKVTIA
jgi:hypothetical protein